MGHTNVYDQYVTVKQTKLCQIRRAFNMSSCCSHSCIHAVGAEHTSITCDEREILTIECTRSFAAQVPLGFETRFGTVARKPS